MASSSQAGLPFAVARPPRAVARLIRLAGGPALFCVHPTLDRALEAVVRVGETV